MPAAKSRTAWMASPAWASISARIRAVCTAPAFSARHAGGPQLHFDRHQLLLWTAVQIMLERTSGLVGGTDDPIPRSLQVLDLLAELRRQSCVAQRQAQTTGQVGQQLLLGGSDGSRPGPSSTRSRPAVPRHETPASRSRPPDRRMSNHHPQRGPPHPPATSRRRESRRPVRTHRAAVEAPVPSTMRRGIRASSSSSDSSADWRENRARTSYGVARSPYTSRFASSFHPNPHRLERQRDEAGGCDRETDAASLIEQLRRSRPPCRRTRPPMNTANVP